MTRDQIRLCIQRLDSIAKQKNLTFEQAVDQVFAIQMEDEIDNNDPTGDNSEVVAPDEHFKEMLLMINDRYGE